MPTEPHTVDLGPMRSAFDVAPIGLALLCEEGDDLRYGYVNPAMQALAPASSMLGRTYAELHPDTAAVDLPRLRAVYEQREAPWIQPEAGWALDGSVAAGRRFRIEWSRVDVGDRACLFNAVTDVTEVVDSRRELERQIESERVTTGLLLRSAALLAGAADLEAILQGLMTAMKTATRRSRVLVSLYDAEHDEIVAQAAEGDSPLAPGSRVPVAALATPVRDSLREHTTVVVDYESAEVPESERIEVEPYGLRIVLSVPLLLGERFLGFVMIDEPGSHEPFSARQIKTVEAIAAMAAAAIGNAGRLDAERLRAHRMERLKRLTDFTSASLSPSEVGERTLRYFADELGVDVTTLWAIDRERRRLHPFAVVGFPAEFLERFGEGVGLDEPFDVSTAYREQRPVVRCPECMAQVPAGVRDTYAHYGVPLGALLVLPVAAGSEGPIGAVTLAWREAHRLDDDEVAFFASAVNTLAIAMENARLYEERDRSAQTAEMLAATSQMFMTAPVDEAVPIALERASALLGAVGAMVAQREEGGWRTIYRFGRVSGIDDYYSDEQSPVRKRMLETRAPVAMADVLASPDADPELAARLGYRSYISHPLIFRDEVIGAISFFFGQPGAALGEPGERVMTRIVYSISSAMENARLFEAQRRQAEYAESLNRINDALHSTLDFGGIMDRVVVELTRSLGVDASAVHVREAGQWRFTHSHGLPEGLREARLGDEDARISARVLRTGRTVVVNDVPLDPNTNRELMEEYAVRALIAVPLIVREERIGVLFTGCLGRTFSFTPEMVDFAEKVAASLSLALENARLYESEHRIAETLQEALISMPDTIGGLTFAHAYRSAAEAARVGGDFYDMFELGDGTVGVMIGDVAGKGLDAAVLTSLVKNSVRAHSVEPGKGPARVLALTNELVVRSTPIEAFVTVFMGVLDCDAGRLTYSSAGHTTGVVVREDGTLLPLPADSPLLGAFAAVEFGESSESLGEADTLFLYTDGLIEARRGKELFGEERLFAVLREAAGEAPQELVDAALWAVREFTADRLTDDLAILAVQRLRG